MNKNMQIDTFFFKERAKKISHKRNVNTKYFKGVIEKTNKRVLEITTVTIYHYQDSSVPSAVLNQFYLKELIDLINKEFQGWNRLLRGINYKFCFFLDAQMNIIEQHYKIVFINKEYMSKIYKIYENELFLDYKNKEFIGILFLKQDLLKTFYNVDIDIELLDSKLAIPLIEMITIT